MSASPPKLAVVAGVSFPDLDTESAILGEIGVAVADVRALSRAQVLEAARDADALMVDYFECDADTIRALRRCRVICQYGVGLDGIDIEAASNAGITVTHTPLYCRDELAEHTLALILAAVRQVAAYDRSVRAGAWDYNASAPLRRVRGSTVGLVGFGRVGRAVAERLSGFGTEILASDDYVADDEFARAGVRRVTLDELLAASDIVSLHVPLDPSTRGLVDNTFLAAVRPGAIIINTSRGAIVNSTALAEALDRRAIAFAALDVLDVEPPPPDHPLVGRDDCILTPHAGFLSPQSLTDLQRDAALEVRSVLTGLVPRFAVNTDRLADMDQRRQEDPA